MKIIIALIVTATFISSKTFALVDYSPRPASSKKSSGPQIDISNLRPKNSQKISTRVRRKNPLGSLFFFSSGYNSVVGENTKYDQYKMGITLMTPWKIYLDLDLSYGGINSEDSSYSLGNTEFSVGATWLEFGSSYDMMSIDVLGGMSLGVEDSDIGSRRSDSYIGLLSKKNFGAIDLSLGVEYWFMDDESFDSELSVGSFNKYLVNTGWTVSSDIRFDLSLQFINLGEVEGVEDISYTEVSPQLGLKLGRGLHLNLGARFSSQKDLGNANLGNLKVWNIPSLYGNSYFSKISFQF